MGSTAEDTHKISGNKKKEVKECMSDEDVEEDDSQRRPKRFVAFVAHVQLLDGKKIERMHGRSKEEARMVDQILYASNDLVKEEPEAKELLNIHR